MRTTNHQSEASHPTAGVRRDLGGTLHLRALVEWLGELSPAELKDLDRALANYDAGRLARFHTRFQARLNRPE
jgi:hypothetical protein